MTDLLTFCVGIALLTMSIAGFFYVLKLQDKYIDKMLGRDGDGDLVH